MSYIGSKEIKYLFKVIIRIRWQASLNQKKVKDKIAVTIQKIGTKR